MDDALSWANEETKGMCSHDRLLVVGGALTLPVESWKGVSWCGVNLDFSVILGWGE
jgi:hypothetical protein